MNKLVTIGLIAIAFIAVIGGIALFSSAQGQSRTEDGHACLIHGTCVVINWEATEETWEEAHDKWKELK